MNQDSPRSKVGVKTVSDDIPERSEMIRSIIITSIFSTILLSLGIVFWFWSTLESDNIVTMLNDINPFLTIVLEILFMSGFFVFLTVTVTNLRLTTTQIRAGWMEVICTLILVTAISWIMFEMYVGIATCIISIGFIVYLYLLQE